MCLSPYTREQLRRGAGDYSPDRSAVPDAVERRLLKAVAALKDTQDRTYEVAGLVGQVLRRCRARHTDCQVELGHLADATHPAWVDAGIEVGMQHGGLIRLSLDKFATGLASHPDVIRAAGGEVCRSFAGVPGDPWMLKLAKRPGAASDAWPTYRSEGQAQAIRGLSNLAPGAVALVLLPTGGGKSMCIHYAVATAPSHSALVVVVVPTVALALDQERELRKVLSDIEHPTAYVGGSDAVTRDDIRRRIREGCQRVVFTSPESLMGSLLHALLAAASKGRLAWFLVDEAHIVESWGEGFRPEFRLLAGFRRAIMRATPAREQLPRTVLLTATATAHVADALRQQMFDPGVERPMPPWCVVGSLALRPEHRYVVAKCDSPAKRDEIVWSALQVLPRPIYLYATTRRDVDDWHQRLRERGFRRVAKVHGGSTTEDRRKVLKSLEDEDVDIVVANSAFGLGVNQADVRSVLHVAVPEDLDRYYQEAGRAGRDGNAAVAVLIYDSVSVALASEMSKPQSIGAERGLRRLRDMWAHKESTREDSVFRLRLNTRAISNAKHESWDRLTLVLLAEAGVLSLEAVPRSVPAQTKDDSVEEEDSGLPWEEGVCATLWDPSILEGESAWLRLVEPTRQRRARQSHAAFEEVLGFLAEPASLSEALSRTYAIDVSGRRVAPPPMLGTAELLRVPPSGQEATPGCWEPMGSARCWFVGFPRTDFERGSWQEYARRSLQLGFRWFVGDLDLLRVWAHQLPPHERDRVILSERLVVPRSPSMPWVAVASGHEPLAWTPFASAARSQAGIVLLPSDTANAEHGNRTLSDDLGAAWLAPEVAAMRLGL